MKFALIIYLFDVLDSLKGFALLIVIFASIAAIFAPMVLDITDTKFSEFWAKVSKPVLISLGISFLILTFVPSQKTAYTMLAAYGAQKVSENPQVQEIAGDSLKVLNKAMKDYLGETKEETK